MADPSPLQSSLSKADVTQICNLAQAAWDQAGPRTRKVSFQWNRIRLVSGLTNFRMIVNDTKGRAVCCRWF